MPNARDDVGGGPIEGAEFAHLMRALGPFEPAPHVAVACSGGADSMALTLLTQSWAKAVGGRVTALTVDHRLRPDSTAEAKQVATWMRARGIVHRILSRPQGPIRGNLQATARRLRYDLLSRWCADNDVLHLLLAHHREDQAETVLLRLARGSGVDGLAAMAPVSELSRVRLLRPLLSVPRARLLVTLAAADQAHVADPSNENRAFARVRLRRAAPILAQEGLTAARLCDTAARAGRARAALEDAAAVLLARAVRLYPQGYARIEVEPVRDAPEEIALRAVARTIACIGGGTYPPRLQRLERLTAALCRPEGLRGGRTLGGCRIVPWRGRVLACREPRAAGDVRMATGEFLWDGRFRIQVDGDPGLEVRRLGRRGWASLLDTCPDLRKTAIPSAVRPTLPAFWDLDVVAFVPHLSYVRHRPTPDALLNASVSFAPVRPLSAARFATGRRLANA